MVSWPICFAALLIVDIVRLVFAYHTPTTSLVVRHRVYMSFQCRYGWHCQFLEQDLKTPLSRKLHFSSSEEVIELVERGGGLTDQLSPLLWYLPPARAAAERRESAHA